MHDHETTVKSEASGVEAAHDCSGEVCVWMTDETEETDDFGRFQGNKN